MNKILFGIAFFLLCAIPVGLTLAQVSEEAEPTLYDEVLSEVISEEVMDDGTTTVEEGEEVTKDPDVVIGIDEDGMLTAGEYEEFLDGSDELSEEVLVDLEFVQGEVVAVNEEDGTVVIETSDGDVLTISTEVYEASVRSFGGGRLLNPKVGDKVIATAPGVELTDASIEVEDKKQDGGKNVLIFVVTDGEKKQISSSNVPVYRNGERTTLASLTNADSVQVAQSADGEVVAIYASSTEADVEEMMDDGETNYWYWLLAIVLLGFAIYFFFRKKEDEFELK